MIMFSTLHRRSKPASVLDSSPRIALVGCGAIAELYYLPAIARYPSVLEKLILVDINGARAQKLAVGFNVQNYLIDYRKVLGEVDGVIIAAPHHLHYSMSMEFLSHGVHVLCEKPLAESAVEAKEMVKQSDKTGAMISVNHTRRLFASLLKVKELLSDKAIGNPLSIKYFEGEKFDWPTRSGFYFDARMSPRGVLLDRGTHALDLICWWLGGKPRLISSQNDSFGGCEAVAHVQFEHNGCVGEVRVSWLHQLPNSYTIEGESGTIEGSVYDWRCVTVTTRPGKKKEIRLKSNETHYADFCNRVVANFLDIASKGDKPLISASDVLDSMELIDECYETASRFSMPWYETLEALDGK